MATSLTTVQVRAASRTPTRRNPLARYTPKSLSADSRWRFIRDRRARYLADIPGGVASDAQAARIERMIKLEWAALVSGRSAPPTGRATEAYADVGRRGGKTRIMSLVAAWLAVFEDWQQFLDPGETAYILVVVKDTTQAGVAFGYLSSLLVNHPILSDLVTGSPTRLRLRGSTASHFNHLR